ncbi:MAG TPA: hypothetical protein PLE50_05755, partial [Rhabdaerophilum sp.]|nr:hypothetical protein [Rhabdaerophilum sp.]
MASYLSLYRELAVFVVPAASNIDNWQGLNGRTIALLGQTRPTDRLIQKVLAARQVTGVSFISASRDDIEGLVRQNRVQAVAQVAPLNIAQHSDIKAGRSVRRIRG